MELYKAHQQWSNRPADETFESISAMHEACSAYRDSANTATVAYESIRVEAVKGDLQLTGREGIPAKLTNWAFGQLSQRAGAPASYLRQLPATLAAQNLNHGLAAAGREGSDEERTAKLLFHRNGGLVLRAATSDKYARIWNNEVTGRLVALQERQPNWALPLAYVREPGSRGFSGLTGVMAPRGAYASDHDMFCLLVDQTRRVACPGTKDGLFRGFFVWNSEVGASSFGLCAFLFDQVCGNQIIWGAKNVSELRIRHVGNASPRAFQSIGIEVRRFAESSTSDMEAKIAAAQRFELGATKDAVLDSILGKRIPEISRKRLDDAYSAAESADRYGSPRTVWGMVNGLTEISQKTPHMDERVKLDRAAGKVLEIAF